MQIFYYISMKCVENYYLVLPLGWGGSGAEREVGSLLSEEADPPLTDTHIHSSLPTPGRQPLWEVGLLRKCFLAPDKLRTCRVNQSPLRRERRPLLSSNSPLLYPPASARDQCWVADGESHRAPRSHGPMLCLLVCYHRVEIRNCFLNKQLHTFVLHRRSHR